MKNSLYLDYAATTPVDPQVIAAMQQCLGIDGVFGNPSSSTHSYGAMAHDAVELARAQVAALIHAEPKEIIWTSGATEANNLALQGYAVANAHKGKHLITCRTEHKAVLDVCQYLETLGFRVTYLPVQANGLIDLAMFQAAFQPDTILVSIMHANNEIGVVQDIAKIADITHRHQAILHVDAAQSAGKIPLDVKQLQVDLLSLSAHKVYGPKGAGALYIRHRPKIPLKPLFYGGKQERGLRSGTLATHQIVGMGKAFALAQHFITEEAKRIRALKERLWQGIASLPKVYRNGDATTSLPGILNVSFAGIDGEALLMALSDLAVATGSACMSATMAVSHVLTALGIPPHLAQSSVRFSLGRFTTAAEIEQVIATTTFHVNKLRQLSPLWSRQ